MIDSDILLIYCSHNQKRCKMALSLLIKAADAVTHSNINALVSKIRIEGTVQRPRFVGDPHDVGDLQYFLAFADWEIRDSMSFKAYTPPANQTGRVDHSFQECLNMIAKGYRDFQTQSAADTRLYHSTIIR